MPARVKAVPHPAAKKRGLPAFTWGYNARAGLGLGHTAQVLALTAPLCLSATVIAFLAFGGWFKHRNGLDGLVPFAVAMVVPYAIAYGFGLVEMYTDVYAGRDLGWQAYHPFMIVMRIPISILAYYFTAYGFQHTITSVFFGIR